MATKTVTKRTTAVRAQDVSHPVHTMVRRIGNSVGVGGVQPVEVVDADVSQWQAKGYELVSTHFIGLESGVVDVMYVLAQGGESQTATHTMIRRIGVAPGVGGVVTTDQVSEQIGQWYADGYRLKDTHFLGVEAGVYDVMYVLVK